MQAQENVSRSRTFRLFVEVAQILPLLLVDDGEDSSDRLADGVTVSILTISTSYTVSGPLATAFRKAVKRFRRPLAPVLPRAPENLLYFQLRTLFRYSGLSAAFPIHQLCANH